MTKSQKIASKYKENLISFADVIKSIIEICIEEEATTLSVVVIEEFKSKVKEIDINKTDYILEFIGVSHFSDRNEFLVWQKIKNREEEYFKENIISLIREEHRGKIKPYIDLIDAVDSDGDPIVDKDFRNVIWEYMDSFVSLALKYLHAKRAPALKKDEDGEMKKVYTKKVLPKIKNKDILKMARLFNVELEW